MAGAVGACGFQPVYGPEGAAKGLHGRIEIEDPSNQYTFDLARQLESRLGLPNAPDYVLSTNLAINQTQLGLTSNNDITRYNISGTASYVLRERGTEQTVTQGTVDSFTSFSGTGTPFATQTAQADAQSRLMVILADQIVSRLLATAGDWRT